MRAAIILSVVALAAGAPKKLSSKFLSTPMARGGGQIVGGTEASVGEFPHQIALLRGGVGGSLMCGGSLVGADKSSLLVTAVTDNPPADSESELETTTSTPTIPTRRTLLCLESTSTPTMTAGPSTTISASWIWKSPLTSAAP